MFYFYATQDDNSVNSLLQSYTAQSVSLFWRGNSVVTYIPFFTRIWQLLLLKKIVRDSLVRENKPRQSPWGSDLNPFVLEARAMVTHICLFVFLLFSVVLTTNRKQ